ncbi:MAG: hypothetical protein KDK91_33645, partial [Gammaproteobacteria bacterium]|nr:hypothetical protein [Gammaproteobacteria bacterium]
MLRTAAGLRWQARAWLLVAMLVSAVSVPAVESDQFYFIGFEAPLGSISQTGQAQSGVLLRWDTLEGELPPDLQSFELSRDGELLATLPASGHMSVAEIAALYALPQSERLRLEAMRWLSEETPDTPVDAGNLAGVLVDRVLASVPRARLSSRIDPNIAVARYRGFRDQPPGLGTFSYTLIGRLADGGTVALGTLDIEVDGISDALAAGQDLAQVQMRRCDAPEAAKDHGGVALNWRHPGANPIEHYAWSLRIAGYDLYRTSSDIDAPPMPLDLRALAASTAHDPAGRIALAGLEKVNDQPIIVAGSATQQSQYQGFNPAFAQFFETHAELLQAGVQPGGRRGYYLVARDQSGNWGDTAVLDVSVPDLSAPPAPWNVRVLPSRATGDVRLMWPQVSVLNYFPVHQAGRQYCNLASADVDGRLDFVYDGETCDQGRTQSVDLEVAEYRVYRFTNSRQALDFVDGDGDGFHDDDERLGLADPGTACDPELPDPDLSPLS